MMPHVFIIHQPKQIVLKAIDSNNSIPLYRYLTLKGSEVTLLPKLDSWMTVTGLEASDYSIKL